MFDWWHFLRVLVLTMIITFIVVIVLVTLRLQSATDYNFKRILRKRFVKQLQTGDLVAISYPSLRGQLVKVFTGSAWAHVAMIVCIRRKGREVPCVLEIGRYSREERGVMLHSIDEWLEKNDERIIGWRPYLGRFNRQRLNEFIAKHRDKNEDMFVVSWLKSMYKVDYKPNKEKGEYYCSEFITRLLQETGVIRKEYDPAGYKPWELIHGQMPLMEGHRYGEPYLLE